MRDVLLGLLGASWAIWLLWKAWTWWLVEQTRARISMLDHEQKRELRRRMSESPKDALLWLDEVTRHG